MFNRNLRVLLIIMCFLISAVSFIQKDYYYGILILIGALLLIYGYFRYASVFSACRKMQKLDLVKMKKLLDETPNPDYLAKSQKGFYYWMSGIYKMDIEKDLDGAECDLCKALEIGVRTKNNAAALCMSLAQINLINGNLEITKVYSNKAKALSTKSELNENIKKLEEALNKKEVTNDEE